MAVSVAVFRGYGYLLIDWLQVYALSSLLALDPWHMITSFIPYIFLSPTYINILNVFVSSCLF